MRRVLVPLMAVLTVAGLMLAVAGAPVSRAAGLAPPTITKVSKAAPTRSDRLLIAGTGFGSASESSHVSVAGLQAPFTRWSNTLIAAYVPESTPLGSATVQVVTAGGSSNTMTVQVRSRGTVGRIAWRFEMDAMYAIVRPATGPDGTVYSVDVSGHLYALTPTGGLKWIFNGAGSKGLDILADGTIVTGDESNITAVNP